MLQGWPLTGVNVVSVNISAATERLILNGLLILIFYCFKCRHGLTYLFISHDLAVVRALAHDLIVMKEGEVVARGETRELFSAAQHPYRQELLAASFAG
ncbi:conserved hypothetical protein [Pseudomonas serboccidentalis]